MGLYQDFLFNNEFIAPSILILYIKLFSLLKKCTIPVKAIATSTGKNIINTGVRIVPSPNPEKKVRMAARKATDDIITKSIFLVQFIYKSTKLNNYTTRN